MKVKDLIAQLQGFDPECAVLVNGYEMGFEELDSIFQTQVKPWQPDDNYPRENRPDWQGEFVYAKEGDEHQPAVIIPRRDYW